MSGSISIENCYYCYCKSSDVLFNYSYHITQEFQYRTNKVKATVNILWLPDNHSCEYPVRYTDVINFISTLFNDVLRYRGLKACRTPSQSTQSVYKCFVASNGFLCSKVPLNQCSPGLSSRDLTLGLKTSEDPIFKVLVLVLVLKV